MRSAGMLFLMLFFAAGANGQSTPDSVLIKEAAMNYMQGWYTGDVNRMKKALHADLAKRLVVTMDTVSKRQYVSNASADAMIELTATGMGKTFRGASGTIEYRLLDKAQDLAMVRLKTADYLDYLQLGKVNGEWKIINILWAMASDR